jgi:alpha-L-glutamate ligase-like protein
MIFKTLSWLHQFGLLGMNRRNAEYIMRLNPRSSFPLVDDKLMTKHLAEANQIPTPPLYHIIEYHGDLGGLEEMLSDHQDFVIKPARGTGGSGILLITGHQRSRFVKPSGDALSWTDLTYHIFDILSGIYSLEGLEDRALIEAFIHPDPVFAAVTYNGVPDIRIVVYRGVPVMGMVRLPTKASDGKANLHRGAIGVGINMKEGTTLTAVRRSMIVTHHPDTNHPLNDIRVPHWKEMLHMAARASEMTGLGYLGVDMVIDQKRGPLLLELNARPGLQIQVANQTGLWSRLELIDQAPPAIFTSPQKRVEWAVKAFAESEA